jgi:hypothetical protein
VSRKKDNIVLPDGWCSDFKGPHCDGCGAPILKRYDPCQYCGRHTPDSLARFAKGPDPKATATPRKTMQ